MFPFDLQSRFDQSGDKIVFNFDRFYFLLDDMQRLCIVAANLCLEAIFRQGLAKPTPRPIIGRGIQFGMNPFMTTTRLHF